MMILENFKSTHGNDDELEFVSILEVFFRRHCCHGTDLSLQVIVWIFFFEKIAIYWPGEKEAD